jgi:hypothetical protein
MTRAGLAKPPAVWRSAFDSRHAPMSVERPSEPISDTTAIRAFRTFVVARLAVGLEPPAAADETLAAVRAEARARPAAGAEAHEPRAAGARGRPAAEARGLGPPVGRDEAREGPLLAPGGCA